MSPQQKREYNREYYRKNPHLREKAKERKRHRIEEKRLREMELVKYNGLGLEVQETQDVQEDFYIQEINQNQQKGRKLEDINHPRVRTYQDKGCKQANIENEGSVATDSFEGKDLSSVPKPVFEEPVFEEPVFEGQDKETQDKDNKVSFQNHLRLVETTSEELSTRIQENMTKKMELNNRQIQFALSTGLGEVSEKIQNALDKVSDLKIEKVTENEVSDSPFSWGGVTVWFQTFMLVAILAISGFIVVSENSLRLSEMGHRWPNLMAGVLEAAIIGLAMFHPKIRFRFSTPADFGKSVVSGFKFLGFKFALVGLVGFSFWISMVSENVAGTEKISAVSKNEGSKDIDRQIEITLAALADFQKKGESGNIAKTQNQIKELRVQRASSMKSVDVQNLKSVYEDEKHMKVASKAMPLIINLIFGHLLGMCWTRRSKLTV